MRGTEASTSPVAGLNTSKVLPSDWETNSPLMKDCGCQSRCPDADRRAGMADVLAKRQWTVASASLLRKESIIMTGEGNESVLFSCKQKAEMMDCFHIFQIRPGFKRFFLIFVCDDGFSVWRFENNQRKMLLFACRFQA
jgi:hypothetical protein